MKRLGPKYDPISSGTFYTPLYPFFGGHFAKKTSKQTYETGDKQNIGKNKKGIKGLEKYQNLQDHILDANASFYVCNIAITHPQQKRQTYL